MEITATLIIIVITVIASLIAFNNDEIKHKLIFYPPAISERKQWYRFFTSGFIHADIPHLLFNMYALYIFGVGDAKYKNGVEYTFVDIFGEKGKLLYLLMYLLALGVCLLPTYGKNKHNYHYLGLGASGGVSAVIFAQILINPLSGMGLIFIPVYIAGFLFGLLYLFISSLLDKRGNSNINHSAHIWGGLFGMAFLVFVGNVIYQIPILENFITQIRDMDPSRLIFFP